MSGTTSTTSPTIDTSNRMRQGTPSFAFVDAAIGNFDSLTAPIADLSVSFTYTDPNAPKPADGSTVTPSAVNGNFLTFISSWYVQFLSVASQAGAALSTTTGDVRYWSKTADMSEAVIGTGATATTLSNALQQAAESGAWNPRGAWAPLTKYAVNDYFTVAGSGYVAIAEFTSGTEFNTDHCVLVVSVGSKGDPGVTTVPVRICGNSATSPGASTVLAAFLADTGMLFDANFGGSIVKVKTLPKNAYTLTVNRNGAPIGTLLINTDGTTVLQTVTNSNVQINAGDIIEIVSPATVDPSIAGIYFTLIATYSAS